MERRDIVALCQEDLPSVSFAVFDDMRKKEELCDITIKLRNSTFLAHKVVLAATIPYFRSAFASKRAACEEKEICVDIEEDMDPSVLESLIHFAYTSRINISTENVHSLLLASELLQLGRIKQACIKFLSERLDVNSVAQVHAFAVAHNYTKLIQCTTMYIRKNFRVICESEGFLHLPYICIKEIISGDDLRTPSEEVVFEAVLNWVKFSPTERSNVLPELLSEIRLLHLDVRYLIKKVASEELIRVSIPCRDLIQNVQSYRVLPEEESTLLNLKTRPRTCWYTPKGIYAVCESRTLGYCVYYCEVTRNTWNLVDSDNLQLRDYLRGVVAVNEGIYLFFDKMVVRFHVKGLKWEILNTPHKSEYIVGAGLLSREKMIYCFGSSNFNFQNKAHCFDTQMNMWLKEEDTMNSYRCDCAAASLLESIYVTGGAESSYAPINTVEEFNLVTRQWTRVSPMHQARQGHGCTGMNGKIYVCGGYNNHKRMDTTEVFDPLTNNWAFISSAFTVKGRCSLIEHSNKIFAFPGEYGTPKDGVFEVYDEETGQCTKSSFALTSGFLNYSCYNMYWILKLSEI